MALTFRGGTHVREYKNTRACPIEVMPAPAKVRLSMSQHIGAPCTPCVSVGDTVLRGQCIGTAENGLGCPVHASVSGKVTAITEQTAPNGGKVRYVEIENDGADLSDPAIAPTQEKLRELSAQQIIEKIRAAGIVGMGGAMFPTYAKLSSALGKAEHVVVNCAECEPFITANHRLLLENPQAVIGGLKILLRALGVRQGVIAVEDNKADAIRKLRHLTKESPLVRIAVLKTKYPQGDERQLIYALSGKELPAGRLPADLGYVIVNAETCAAVYTAFTVGTPLTHRILTCDGDCVRTPKNLLVPIGTSLRDVIAFCGGLCAEPKKIISGGPMMGAALWDVDSPVTKGTSSVLVFSEKMLPREDAHACCIRCGRCVHGCPMHLMPVYAAHDAKLGDYVTAQSYAIMSCVECGTCSYNCPGNVPLVQNIRKAKAEIREQKKAREAALRAAQTDAGGDKA